MNQTADKPSLRALLAAPVPLQVGSLVLQVAPMGWHQGSRAIEHLMPALQALPLAMADDEGADDQSAGAGQSRGALWAAAVLTYRDEIAAFAAVATGLDEAELRALPPAAMVELVMGLVEINLDFFVQSLPGAANRVLGRLGSLMERIKPVLARLDAAELGAQAAQGAQGYTTSSSGS